MSMSYVPEDPAPNPKPARHWWHPRFTPDVNFGHVMQAGIILITIGGGAITSYITLRDDIATVSWETKNRLGLDEQRITTLEHAIADQRQDEHDFQVEMRAAIQRATELLIDVQKQISGHR